MWALLLLCCLTPSIVLGQYSWEQYSSTELSVRQWHSSICSTGNNIVTYGGYNNLDDEALNDLLAYSPAEQRWASIYTAGGPTGGRYSHTASLVHGKMLIIGGRNLTSYISEVWELDLGTFCRFTQTTIRTFTQPPTAAATYEWQRLPELPFPRAGHSTVVSDDGVVYTIGGAEGAPLYLNSKTVPFPLVLASVFF